MREREREREMEGGRDRGGGELTQTEDRWVNR